MVTTHTYDERIATCEMVKASGMELCCGGIIGLGESIEQRAELATQLAALEPDEVPLNFLNPRPGTPLGRTAILDGRDALRTSRRSDSRCRAPSFAMRVGERSRSATLELDKGFSVVSTR